MAVTICVTSARVRSAVKGMARVMTDSGGNAKSSVSCFMHASSPSNYGHVTVDAQLSKYLYRYHSDSGILVARPLR